MYRKIQHQRMPRKIKFSFLACLLLVSRASFGQNLPDEWSISPDGRRLQTGLIQNTGLYDSANIRTVNLTFPQSNYWSLLTSNYASKTLLPASMEVDGITYDSVGVRFRGNTSYQQTGTSQKKSFSIHMDYVHDNQDIMGYKTLHFNNSQGDRSFLREVFYLHQIRKYIPAAKANFVHLYLNSQDWGIYPNVQKLNKDFFEEWYLSNDGINFRADRPTGNGGGWGDGTAALNYLGTDTSSYQTYYTLKSSDVLNPWDKLVAVCSTLNNSGTNLKNTLPDLMDIDRTLWMLACENIFTDDDSYVMKGKMDYHLWYEAETGRMMPIEYDGNSALVSNVATTWSPFYHETNVNYPLLNKVLAVPEWRQRYLAHYRTIIKESLDTAIGNAMINNYKNQIDALVNSDPKKLYTYANFTSEINVLKNFIKNRRTYLLANTEVMQAAPEIANVSYSNNAGQLWSAPADMQPSHVTASVSSGNGVDHVTLYFATGLTGNFSTIAMEDDGAHNDSAAGDGIYGASIPGYSAGTWVRFYVEAAAANSSKSVSYAPAGAEHDVFIYTVPPVTAPQQFVAINEVMASNTSTIADADGEYDDWIELFNKSSQPVDISGWYITDNVANLDKFEIAAGTILPANGYLTFWADEDSSQGVSHCNFKLSADGEFVYLLNSSMELVDSVMFGVQVTDNSYSRVPNGTGSFTIKGATYGYNNEAAHVGDASAVIEWIKVYPNPATGSVNIDIPGRTKGVLLEIRNALGQPMYSSQAAEQTILSTAHWSPGIYYVRYGSQSVKLLIIH
ncbi:MAG: T9SS type A sorting domain-containing protein [Sphingobacteriales bacterium]|nr:MAG: T9SS type A sorting domain-containing protein [Sphingobacteriales bacterium]